jgi:hypothetical protein
MAIDTIETTIVSGGDAGPETELPNLTAKEAKSAQEREEKSDLRKLETIITKGDRGITLMAEALTEIRDRRLYKRSIDPETGKGYTAFAKYLLSHTEWGFTAQYANRLIANLRDQKAIEAGEEPEAHKTVGPRELTANEAAMKIAKSFAQWSETNSKYRDAVDDDAFRTAFDAMYAKVEGAVNKFVNAYPAPVVEDETETTDAA